MFKKILLTLLLISLSQVAAYFVELNSIEDAEMRDGSPTLNFGGAQNVHFGTNGGVIYRGLIKINYEDSIPDGAVVDSAKLYMYIQAINSAPQNVSIYQVLVDWNAGSKNGAYLAGAVSWDSAKTGITAWNAAGASGSGSDYVATPITSYAFANSGAYDSVSIEDAFNSWIQGSPNYGILLTNDDETCGGGANCRIRTRAEEHSDSSYVRIWYQIPPQLTGLSGGAEAGATQSDSSTVTISYEIYDPDDATNTVSAQYCLTSNDCSAAGAGWTAMANTTGDLGTVSSTSSSSDRFIYWDVETQLGSSVDDTYRVRLIAVDDSSSVDTLESADFIVDTQAPTSLAGFSMDSVYESSADVSWSTPAADNHFSHYEIWFAEVKANVEARNASAVEWDHTDDANLANAATTSTLVQLLSFSTKYFFKIWAIDSAGNEISLPTDSGTTQASDVPLVSGYDPETNVSGVMVSSDSVKIQYEVLDLDDSVVTVTVETKLASQGSYDNWATVDSYMSGDTGTVVQSTTTDRLIIWDIAAQHGTSVNETATVRVIAVDSNGNADTSTSASFTVDTQAPTAPSALTSTATTSSSVSLSWTAGSDANFNHYEIWYGTDQTEVENRNIAAEWDDSPQDANLATASTTSTTITGLQASVTYYFHIWAVDDYGNEADYGTTYSVATAATTDLQITDIEDNVMRSNNTSANCGSEPIRGGPTAGRNGGWGGTKRSLVKINMSEVPAGATIVSATFTARCNAVGDVSSVTIEAFPLLQAFVEGTDGCGTQAGSSCWNDYGAGSWSTPGLASGVDYEATAVSSQSVADVGTYSWDLTSVVQEWVNGTRTNNGLVFIESTESGTTGKFFDAAEGAIPPFLDVQYTLGYPEVTGLSDAALIGATMTGDPDSATISFEVSDPNDVNVTITLQYKLAVGGSWADATEVLGYSGSQSAADGDADRSIRWAARSELGNVDNNYMVRIIATDGTLSDTTESASFAIDTKAPVGLANLNVGAYGVVHANLSWTSVTSETNFSHYEIWYGSDLTDVQNRTGSADEWDNNDDNGLLTVGTTTTSITGLSASTLYYFKIWAIDDIGNEATVTFDSVTTQANAAPTVTGLSAAAKVGATQSDTDLVSISFEIDDTDGDTADCSLEYFEVGTGPWTSASNVTGNTGGVKFTNGQDLSMSWDVLTALSVPTSDATYKIRVLCTDTTSLSDTTESANFTIDLVDPTGMSGISVGTIGATTAGLSWNSVSTENHFSHYEIWYGTVQNDVNSRSGTALEWDGDNDASLRTMTTDTTTITALSPLSTYYFKIWSQDSAGNEQTLGVVSGSTGGTNAPIVTGPSDVPNISASQSSTTQVTMVYEVDDADDASVTVTAQYCVSTNDCSKASSDWTAMTNTSGDIGASIATHATNDKTITWTAATQLGSVEGTYYVRVIVDDLDGATDNDTASSASFTLDTQAPSSPASLATVEALGSTMELSWTAVSDANFNHYEIWYGTTSGQASGRTGTEWDNSDDGNLANSATTSTIITGLTSGTDYWWHIWAVDDIGNETSDGTLNQATPAIKTPQFALDADDNIGDVKGAVIAGSGMYVSTANIGGSEDNITKRNASTGAFMWQFSTSAYGSPKPSTFTYSSSAGKYIIHSAAGTRIIGIQDNGSSKTDLFVVNLGGTAGTPYGDPGDNQIAVVAGGSLYLRNFTTGAAIWGPMGSNLSSDGELIFDNWTNNVIYAPGSNGTVYAFNISDGSSFGSYSTGAGSVSLALWQMNGFIYAAPSDNSLHKINDATMTGAGGNWPVSLSGNNTGGLWYDWNTDVIYVTTTAGIQAFDSDGNAYGTARSLTNINSAPLVHNNVVYFGRDGGEYYAVDPSNLNTDRTDWPYTAADGNARSAPAADWSNGRVIFGTDNENIDSFTQE